MLKLTILSPEKKVTSSIDVESVTLNGSEGQIQILPEHADMIGTLETGTFAYKAKSGEEAHGVISSGFFEVLSGQVSVMGETVELAKDIDLSRAKAAQRKAEGALQDPELDPPLFKKYQLKLQRALIRQQAAGGSHLH